MNKTKNEVKGFLLNAQFGAQLAQLKDLLFWSS